MSRNFRLEEMLQSSTADKLKKQVEFENLDHANNATRLIESILQPLRDKIGKPIHITSGYRPEWLNTAVGGAKTSAHLEGRAADIKVYGMSCLELAKTIVELGLPFDKVINEFENWVHVSIAKDDEEPRKEKLRAVKIDGKTVYKVGLL